MWRNWKPTLPRVDVPEFTRCCFCLPLRYGLLVWGYLKLTLLSFMVYQIIRDIIRWSGYPSMYIITIILLLDIIFNVVFIVAGHLKHQLLFWVYYYYSIGVLCSYLIFLVWFICWNWYGFYYFSVGMVLRLTLEILTTFLPVLFVQGYVTLLVRTEARKLANNSNLEFFNNASEASCSIDLPGTNNVPTITQVP